MLYFQKLLLSPEDYFNLAMKTVNLLDAAVMMLSH